MLPNIPEKKYYKIGEVSRLFDLEPHVLRFWETEFSSVRPKKDSGNQRLYQRRDLESIARIKKLLYEEKFTIAGAREKLKEMDAAGRESKKTSEISSEADTAAKLIQIKKGLLEIRDILS
jgi:DNA-binding transcriptional MerR regulator